MAREEHEREDLLREATAYVERIELELLPGHEQVFVGFRRDGSPSFYFGGEPVYHFNTRGELRRAHADGLIIKAELGRLATLDRQRTKGEVRLVRHDLGVEEMRNFLQRVTEDLQRLHAVIAAGEVRIVGQVPDDAEILARVSNWLADQQQIVVAQSPGVA